MLLQLNFYNQLSTTKATKANEFKNLFRCTLCDTRITHGDMLKRGIHSVEILIVYGAGPSIWHNFHTQVLGLSGDHEPHHTNDINSIYGWQNKRAYFAATYPHNHTDNPNVTKLGWYDSESTTLV